MRLKQIKLAGFKSFVDPTTVPFPENLTAIVGPNGCGKSNLIDAVRWVMGESSAKHLRGDSMTDVIFNGSTTRKPVGQASIELVFDNSDGTIAGEYANYSEISVRRSVNRDANASYFLNGTKCRRKDITDIFLGTGLGPRSYAIIEQGMITRLIESKPQELRVFLEEAAGISKYKERRRETENRIRHTRENMERLTDIREELGKQLAHLQRQANAANKYKEFKQQERQLKSELSALKWQKFHGQAENLTTEINKMETELEARVAEQRSADNQIEQTRDNHITLTESFNEAQGRYYGIGAEIARLEQGIAHKKERRVQLKDDLHQVSGSLSQLLEQMDEDEIRAETLESDLLDNEPELELAQEAVENAKESLSEIEISMLEWEEKWDTYNKSSAENNQKMEVERTRIQHFERVIENLLKRIDKNQDELNKLNAEPVEDSMLEASVELSKAEETAASLSDEVEDLLEQISTSRQTRRDKQSELEQCRKQLQSLQSQHISLSAMQKAALGSQSSDVENWLNSHELSQNKKIAQNIKVKSGWEKAVETVLGEYLESVSVDNIETYLAELNQLSQGRLILCENSSNNGSVERVDNCLLDQVDDAQGFEYLLASVQICESVEQAIDKRASLKSGQSIITADGFWVSKNWARIAKKEIDEVSVLERESQIEELSQQLAISEEKFELLSEQVEEQRDQLKEVEANWEEKQKLLSVANKKHSELRAKVGLQQAKLEQEAKRKSTLEKEIVDLKEQLEADEKLVSQSRSALEILVDAMANDLDRKESLTQHREDNRNSLDQARSQVHNAKDQAHKLELIVANIKSEISSVRSTNQRMNSQIAELQSRKLNIEDSLGQVDSPDDEMQLELEEALEKRLESEQTLAEAREALEEVDRQIRGFEKQRHEAEQLAQGVRSRLERLKMQWSENTTMQKNQAESLSDDTDIQTILANLEEGASEEAWQEKIETTLARIQRLGAINLAAIEEHEQQSERKVYLDKQFEDLEESLNTLEGAIRKIDKETRTRFKETFDKVNAGMKELFPKVFGGGHAYLELTGDDLLDTGVAVMARPPGKRNSTIHLLSGGEKALTALSLVFSIFRLNPAPFCMLDEVDAPLDDANVGRFCKLVKEMSEAVQFIYITHNKVSMEMASALAGVTMQEPGASRLVAVDVDEAAELISQ